jgi:hypothetical protein
VIDIAFLFDIGAVAVLVAIPLFVLRRLAGDEPIDLSRMFAAPRELPWPRGIQEEDPQPWRLDGLRRRPVGGAPTGRDRVAWESSRPQPATAVSLDGGACS